MDGGWKIRNGFFQGLGVEVTGKTMGIVGMGNLGHAIFKIANGGFGMGVERVVAWICGLDHVRELSLRITSVCGGTG